MERKRKKKITKSGFNFGSLFLRAVTFINIVAVLSTLKSSYLARGCFSIRVWPWYWVRFFSGDQTRRQWMFLSRFLFSCYGWYSCHAAPSHFDPGDCAGCEIALNGIRPKHYGQTFVLTRQTDGFMVNNYDLRVQRRRGSRNAVRTSKGRSGDVHVRVLAVCYFLPCAAAPQAYQWEVFSILSILWVRILPVPTRSSHYTCPHVCVCVGEGKKHINKEAEERVHSKLWNVPEVLFCQQRGNGINIFKTSIVSVAFDKKKKEKKNLKVKKKKIPSPSGPVLLQRKHPVILYTIVWPHFFFLDKWDASFMRGGWDGGVDWFWHRDICSVLCVLLLLDWCEDWGWRVMNRWQKGHRWQSDRPIIKGSEIPQVQSDRCDQRRRRLVRLCPVSHKNLYHTKEIPPPKKKVPAATPCKCVLRKKKWQHNSKCRHRAATCWHVDSFTVEECVSRSPLVQCLLTRVVCSVN